MPGLNDNHYLKFPLTVDSSGPQVSDRIGHVREQIEQVLFTDVRERVFRPEFGVGVRRLVFEPNNPGLINTVRKRLDAALADALFGEVDPRTLEIGVQRESAELVITISYVLAALNSAETHRFLVPLGGDVNG